MLAGALIDPTGQRPPASTPTVIVISTLARLG